MIGATTHPAVFLLAENFWGLGPSITIVKTYLGLLIGNPPVKATIFSVSEYLPSINFFAVPVLPPIG